MRTVIDSVSRPDEAAIAVKSTAENYIHNQEIAFALIKFSSVTKVTFSERKSTIKTYVTQEIGKIPGNKPVKVR